MTETLDEERQYDGERLAALGDELPNNYTSARLEASAFIKSGAGRLFGFTITNTSGSTVYAMMLDDGPTILADGAQPTAVWPVPPTSTLTVTYGTIGRWFGAGLWLLGSTTLATKTLSTAVLIIDAQYV